MKIFNFLSSKILCLLHGHVFVMAINTYQRLICILEMIKKVLFETQDFASFSGLAASLGVGALSEVTKKSLGLTKKEGKHVYMLKFYRILPSEPKVCFCIISRSL